ncbi:hypothetical protein [Pseudomonas sp. NPDC012596]|uniref:hypothetical protein n=1 Tax=Pseudomonas sp. NPDC012596 TaxID=3364419 RepID=UPI0036B795E2
MWLAIVLTALLLAFNFKFAILKVGTEPLLKLHSYIYVLVSFMIAWGNLILLATLGYWLVQARKMKLETLFYILILEGAVTAVSMGSRAQMILHVAAPFVVYLTHSRELVTSLRMAQWVRILLVTAALFVASLLMVSADRLHSFAQAKPVAAPLPVTSTLIVSNTLIDSAPEQPSSQQAAAVAVLALENMMLAPAESSLAAAALMPPAVPMLHFTALTPAAPPDVAPLVETAEIKRARWKGMLMELSKLVVDRWVGIEGVLAVVSYPDTGWPLFVRSLGERPESGTQAIYQRMSDAQYQTYENFTFMTIPGPLAILLYSNNLAVLMAGLALLFVAGLLAEQLARQMIGNIFTQAAIGVALAYLVVQTNFPRVQFFFFIELLGFIGGLYVARLILTGSTSRLASPAPAF